MTNTKQCCGNCHWFRDERFEYHANGIAGTCVAPRPESAMNMGTMRTDEGITCPTFRQRGERLPQRFRYRDAFDKSWSYGVCIFIDGAWRIRTESGGVGRIADENDMPKSIAQICLEPLWLEWIDRDYGWKDVTA